MWLSSATWSDSKKMTTEKFTWFLACQSIGFRTPRSREVIEIPIMLIKRQKPAPNNPIASDLPASWFKAPWLLFGVICLMRKRCEMAETVCPSCKRHIPQIFPHSLNQLITRSKGGKGGATVCCSITVIKKFTRLWVKLNWRINSRQFSLWKPTLGLQSI